MRSIPGIIEYSSGADLVSYDDALIGSSESHEHCDGSPSKSGSAEHGRAVLDVTDDIDQVDHELTKPTTASGELSLFT